MVSFKKLTTIAGYFTFFLFFGVLAFLFFGFVEKSVVPQQKVKFRVKEKASGVDIWRVSKTKRYHLVADQMIKQKNGVVELFSCKLWILQEGKPAVFIKADRAFVYPDNDVFATGDVFLKRKDLRIYAEDVRWFNKEGVLKSNKAFKGFNDRSKFKGKSFVYLANSSILKARKVDIWLK